jgi:hypothetical protein
LRLQLTAPACIAIAVLHRYVVPVVPSGEWLEFGVA